MGEGSGGEGRRGEGKGRRGEENWNMKCVFATKLRFSTIISTQEHFCNKTVFSPIGVKKNDVPQKSSFEYVATKILSICGLISNLGPLTRTLKYILLKLKWGEHQM
jgi:hypothetical protein